MTRKNDSTLIVVSAPSGCGKDTLIARVAAEREDIVRTVTATTRAPRPGEVDHVDYDFLTEEAFDRLVEENGFWEHARYGGHQYGTVKRNVEKLISEGVPYILLKIDVQGAQLLRSRGYSVNTVFVLPPSFAELRRRLQKRDTDSPEDVQKRLNAAITELKTAPEYDRLIVNDDLEEAVHDLITAIERGPGAERFDREHMLPVWREVMKDAQV